MRRERQYRLVRTVPYDAPMRLQPTWFLVRLAILPTRGERLAEARLALKERRLSLEADLALIAEAEKRVQENAFLGMRMRLLSRRARAARTKT